MDLHHLPEGTHCLANRPGALDRLTSTLVNASPTSLARCKVELANYFAAAVLMPSQVHKPALA